MIHLRDKDTSVILRLTNVMTVARNAIPTPRPPRATAPTGNTIPTPMIWDGGEPDNYKAIILTMTNGNRHSFYYETWEQRDADYASLVEEIGNL